MRQSDELNGRQTVATVQIDNANSSELGKVIAFLNRADCLEIITFVMAHGNSDVPVELECSSQLRTATSVTRFKFKDKKPATMHPVETIDSLEI